MSDVFKVEVPLSVAVDAVVAGIDSLSDSDVERLAGALGSRGVNVPGGRDPGFNIGDHEGGRRRADSLPTRAFDHPR